MRPFVSTLFILAALLTLRPTFADENTLTPDSLQQTGVPQGVVTHHTFNGSKIFPGTERDYWIYVPKQYDTTKLACLMVFQDGGGYAGRDGGFRMPVVFDNLIAQHSMPVTIAVMVNPGVVPAAHKDALPRYNRSVEYDVLSDDYAKFLIDELLPEVGKSYKISSNPDDRGFAERARVASRPSLPPGSGRIHSVVSSASLAASPTFVAGICIPRSSASSSQSHCGSSFKTA